MDRPAREQLDRLISEQLGHVTRSQLLSAGLAATTVRRRVSTGRLHQVGRQVFRIPGTPIGPDTTVAAACLEVDGVASHRTAVWLHGLGPSPNDLEVTVARPANHQPSLLKLDGRRVVVHATTNLVSADLLVVRSVPCLSVARALLTFAALVPRQVRRSTLEATIGRAMDRELASTAWLWATLEARRCRGRNGVQEFERALEALCDLGPAESWLEREFLRLLLSHGFPQPQTQRVVRRSGRFVARVDFCFDDAELVVEVLGHAFHRTREQLASDSARANELQLCGWRVLQFSYDQVVRDPGPTLRTLRAALDRFGSPPDRSVV